MFVYLKYEKGIKRISEVTLFDCSKPKCRHIVEDRIDPALWYKVLILDSIFVDCDKRCVFWSRENLQEAEYIHKCQEGQLNVDSVWAFFKDRERIFKEGECYDYDPTIDELFDTAVLVFQRLNWENVDKDGNSFAYENLLRMLHVFILPKIKFIGSDKDGVAVVLKWIEKHHESIEEQIEKKGKTKRNTENGLHEQRKRLLEDGHFSKTSYVATCDPEFLDVFLPHLEKFIRKCNDELGDFDRYIAPIRTSLTREDIEKLKVLRTDRDALYETLQKAMTAREEIKNVVSRKHVKKKLKKPKKAKVGSFQLMYVEISKRLQSISDEIQDLIKTKIKISSVREAVLLTLTEIERDGYSYGYNCRKGSFQTEMDMFDPNHKPEEWTTLPEKVALHLQIKHLRFRSDHEKFCQRVKLKLQHLYDDSKLFTFPTFDVTPPNDSENTEVKRSLTSAFSRHDNTLGIGGRAAGDRRSAVLMFKEPQNGAPQDMNGYSSRWSIGSVSKEECQRICEDITSHIYDMSNKMAKEIYEGNYELPPKSFVNKIYVCYEEHVSSELIPILNDLYERSYYDHCECLATWLSKMPVSEVCGGNMKLMNILSPSGSSSSSEQSLRESSSDMEDESGKKIPIDQPPKTATLGSKNIKDMSLEELYMICNQQCASMPMSFFGALDMDLRDETNDSSSSSDDNSEQTLVKEIVCESRLSNMSIQSDEQSNKANGEQTTINEASMNILEPPPYTEVDLRRTKVRMAPPPPYTTLPPMIEKLYDEFSEFESFIKDEDNEATLFGKLRQMTGIIRYIESTLMRLRKNVGVKCAVCADDLVDVIIFLLCKLDRKLLLKLYAHMNLMIHLSPAFMQGNAHEYALVTLNVAYQHLFEQCVMNRSAEQ